MSNPYYGYKEQNYYQSYNNSYNYQMQMLSNKQKITQIQDQKSSNDIMCRVLSELENLAITLSYPGKKYFGYYATIPNNYQDIINQIIFQMKIFDSSYKNFVKNNPGKQYIFPNNLQYTNVTGIVNNWISYLSEKAKTTKQPIFSNVIKYYVEFLNILSNGNLSVSFKNEFENIGKNSPPISQNELRRAMNAGSTAACFMNEEYNEIEQEILKKGDYKVNVILNRDRKENKFYNHMDRYDNQLNNYKKELYSNLYIMLGYLEKYAILNQNMNKAIHPKYNKYIKNNSNNKDEIYNQYSNYLDKFYNLYHNNEVDFEFEPKELQEFVNDITNWKSNINNCKIKEEMNNAINLLKRKYESMK